MARVQLVEQVIARCRAAGITVHEMSGWRTRPPVAGGDWAPRGIVMHHTAIRASRANPWAGLRTCVEGRIDLPGPLCQTLGAYDGSIWVITADRANHAGMARASGPIGAGHGNLLYWGHEIDYYPDAPMSAEQYRTATILGRAVVDALGVTPDHVRAHAETSVTGKWDPGYSVAPARTIDMGTFRRFVAAVGVVPPAPAPRHDQEDTMFVRYRPDPAKPAVIAVLSGPIFVGLGAGSETASAEAAIRAGATVLDVGATTWAELDRASHNMRDDLRRVVVVDPKG